MTDTSAAIARGYAIGADFGGKLRSGYERRQIAKELTKDYGTEEEQTLAPSGEQVSQRVKQGQAEAGALKAMQPGAAKPSGLVLKGAEPYQPAAALDTITSGNVLGTAEQAAARTPEQAAAELTQTKKVRVENPMQEYLRYQGAALKAAELGNLDLNKAYTDMAKASFQTNLTKAAAGAFSALQAGDAKPLEKFMSSDFVPNGYKYKNMRVLENGDVEADVIGDKGATTRTVIPQSTLLSAVNLTTNPEFLGKMAEADIKSRADRAQIAQKLRSDEFLKNLGFQHELQLEGMRQSGQDRRKAADLSVENAKLKISEFNAKNQAWYQQASIGAKLSGQAENQLNNAVKDLTPEQRMLAVGLAKNGVTPQVAAGMAATGMDKFSLTFDPKQGAGVRYAPLDNAFVRLPPKALIDAAEPDPEKRVGLMTGFVGQLSQAMGPEATALLIKMSDKDAEAGLAAKGILMSGSDFKKYAILGQEAPAAPAGGGLMNRLAPPPAQVQARIDAEKARPAPAPAPARGFSIGGGPLSGARTLDYPNR